MSDALLDAPPVEAEQDDSEAWLVAWAIVLLLANGNANRLLSATQRLRARNVLRLKFEDDALRWAQSVVAGQVDAPSWRVGVGAMITDYARQQAVAGAGTMPDDATQRLVVQRVAEQDSFLDRFGGMVAAGMLSLALIAARTKLYGGVGWGAYFYAAERDPRDYVVAQWVARDDNRMCANCASYSGQYYLLGQGPFPGQDCLARGACRCERRQVVDRAIWQRLTGRRA